MRKVIAIILVLFILILGNIVTGQGLEKETNNFDIFINDEPVKLTKEFGFPELLNERTMVPIRVISENMGYKVGWENSTRKVTITDRDTKVEFFVGDSHALVNGNRRPMDVQDGKVMDTKAYIKGTRTMVPLRFISEAFGAEIKYDRVNGRHIIHIVIKDEEVDLPIADDMPEPKFKVLFYNGSDLDPITLDLLNPEDFLGAKISTSLKAPWDKYNKTYWLNLLMPEKGLVENDFTKTYSNILIDQKTANRSRKTIFNMGFMPNEEDKDGNPIVFPESYPKKGDVIDLEVKIEKDGKIAIYELSCKVIDVYGGEIDVMNRMYEVDGNDVRVK